MSRKWVFFSLVLMFAVSGVSGLADEQSTATTNPSVWSQVADKLYVSYWSIYNGPSVNKPNGYTTDSAGNLNKKPQLWENLMTVGYRASGDTIVGVGLPFNLLPFANAGAQIKAPFLRVIQNNIINSNGVKMGGDLRLYAGVGDIAARHDIQTGLRLNQMTTYLVPGTSLTFGEQGWVRGWVYGPNGSGNRKDVEINFSPFANYRFNSKLAATLWTDVLQLGHPIGAPVGFNNDLVDIQPGVLWDITPSININPFLNMIPGNFSADTTTLGAIVNVKLL